MVREYEVVLERADGAGPGRLEWVTVPAADESEAREMSKELGVIKGVYYVRAVVDWGRGTFNKEEAAEYLRCSPASIDKYMGDGLLPKAEGGYPVFTRAMLDRVIARRMMGMTKEAA